MLLELAMVLPDTGRGQMLKHISACNLGTLRDSLISRKHSDVTQTSVLGHVMTVRRVKMLNALFNDAVTCYGFVTNVI